MPIRCCLPGSEELRLESQQEYSAYSVSVEELHPDNLSAVSAVFHPRGQSEASDLTEAAVSLAYVAWALG